MKKMSTGKIIGAVICFILILGIGTGCTYQRRYRFRAVDLPEEVYLRTALHKSYTPNIMVLPFESPGTVRQVGEKAAMQLCTKLLESGIDARITYDDTTAFTDVDHLVRFVRENRYDYVVTGKVLYYLNGAISTSSRVETQMAIYGVSGRRLEMVGDAKAVETARPLHETDFIVVEGRGASAPSAGLLLERNAGKFAQLIGEMLSESPDGIIR
jgi:hypothetical protein